jgi:nitrate/nitrite transporter NarK
MNRLDRKIEYHEHGKKSSGIVMIVAPLVGLISDHFGVEIWSWIFFIEMICFMVLLLSILRLQTLNSIRGTSANE